jgi:hypothetical protein
MKKYKLVRMPIEAFDNFNKKKIILDGILKDEKIPNKLKFTDTLRFFSQKPTYVYNEEVLDYYKRKKRRKLA